MCADAGLRMTWRAEPRAQSQESLARAYSLGLSILIGCSLDRGVRLQ